MADPGKVWSKLPSLLNRSGSGVNLNSAWIDVAKTLGLPGGASIMLRVATVVLVALGAWLAWTRVEDARLRIVTVTSILLIGSFLAGTLSEYHFMLTLVPLAMTVTIAKSVMRTVTAGVGIVWTMGVLVLPTSVVGLNPTANHSAFRAFGMSLLLLTAIVVLLRRRHDRSGPTVVAEPPDLERSVEPPLEMIETTSA